MLCKDAGHPITKCLMKMKEGETTNSGKHLREKHREKLKEIAAAEEAAKEVSGKMCRIIIPPNIFSHSIYSAID